jgi:hypothetical protein
VQVAQALAGRLPVWWTDELALPGADGTLQCAAAGTQKSVRAWQDKPVHPFGDFLASRVRNVYVLPEAGAHPDFAAMLSPNVVLLGACKMLGEASTKESDDNERAASLAHLYKRGAGHTKYGAAVHERLLQEPLAGSLRIVVTLPAATGFRPMYEVVKQDVIVRITSANACLFFGDVTYSWLSVACGWHVPAKESVSGSHQ